MLRLYLDDSGADEQSVGGCIADVKSWEAFEPSWCDVLNEFHVEWFHAVDFEAREGFGRDEHRKPGFPPMNDSERDEFRRRLAAVLQQHVGIPVPLAVKASGSRWGGYVCLIIPPGAVRMKAGLQESDRVNYRAGRAQPNSKERFVEDVVTLSHDAYGHCLQQALRLAAETFALPLGEPIDSFVADQPKKNGLVAIAYAIARSTPRLASTFRG